MPGRIVKLIKFAICFCFLLTVVAVVVVAIVSAWPLNIYAYCIFNCNLNNSQVKRTIEMRYGLSSLNRSFSSNKMLPDNLPHSHTHTHPQTIPPLPLRLPFDSKLAEARAPVALFAWPAANGNFRFRSQICTVFDDNWQPATGSAPACVPPPSGLLGDWMLLSSLSWSRFQQLLCSSVKAVAAHKEIR